MSGCAAVRHRNQEVTANNPSLGGGHLGPLDHWAAGLLGWVGGGGNTPLGTAGLEIGANQARRQVGCRDLCGGPQRPSSADRRGVILPQDSNSMDGCSTEYGVRGTYYPVYGVVITIIAAGTAC